MTLDILFAVIITYQEKSGNYNFLVAVEAIPHIITYQEKSGNYNSMFFGVPGCGIITYQEKSGNYNVKEYQKSLE